MSKETETKVVEMATEAAPKTIEQLKVRESELDQINDDLIKEMQTREYEIDFKTKKVWIFVHTSKFVFYYELNKFNNCHWCIITVSKSSFYNSSIPTISFFISF